MPHIFALAFALSQTAALLFSACNRSAKDSYVVIHSDVNCDVPRVFQLRVTISNGGVADQKLIPEIAGAEMGFPSSLTLAMPGSRSGAVDIVVEAIDNAHQIAGRGTATGTLVAEGRIDVKVQISAGAVLGPGIVGSTSSSSGVDGGVTADASSSGGQDAVTVTGASIAFSATSAGSLSTCAVGVDSSLWCWGSNAYGQLRLTGTSDRLTLAEVSGTSWNSVACGQTHACGIRVDGTLSCWGNNSSGQLGAVTTGSADQQVEVPDGPWQDVSAGSYQTCAARVDGTLWCWGSNTNGQLGNGDTLPSNVPVQLDGAGYTQVSVGFMHGCALRQDGTLWCWGLNSSSQLALESLTFAYRPTQVPGTGWSQVATGLYHTCGLKQDGSLWCWGGNLSGQIGNSTLPVRANAQTSTPLQVVGAWLSVAAGASHTCGIMSDQSLWCWGDNSHGQLGIGSTIAQSTPASVTTTEIAWSRIAAGTAHTCALANDGSLWCWGSNSDGQLGTGSNESHQSPVRVRR
jgi:alpha-tubulin suppressor-like RCC1 family protein